MISTIIIFLIVLAVLIIVHECGHFFAARFFGIRVDEFGLGFGPKLFGKKVHSKKHGTTEYTLNAIPFGGFVRIFGEVPDAESTTGSDSHRSFINKPRWAQAIVLVAGVASNFIFAWLILSFGFLWGMPVPPNSYPQYADRLHQQGIVVLGVTPGSPADKAGLVPGVILTDTTNVNQFEAITNQTNGLPITIHYKKNADATSPVETLSLTPVKGLVSGRYAIGISLDDSATLSLPIHLALLEGARFGWHIFVNTLNGLGSLVGGLFIGDTALLGQVSGPVGIAHIVGQAAHAGFSYLIIITALISINLGIINLIPFPALDGGRIFFVAVEAITRKPIKHSIANTINAVGFGLLLLLIAVVTVHDIYIQFVH